jgi:hypothetical protein
MDDVRTVRVYRRARTGYGAVGLRAPRSSEDEDDDGKNEGNDKSGEGGSEMGSSLILMSMSSSASASASEFELAWRTSECGTRRAAVMVIVEWLLRLPNPPESMRGLFRVHVSSGRCSLKKEGMWL